MPIMANYNKVELEKMKMAVLQAVSPLLVEAAVDWANLGDFTADQLVLRVTGFIWAEGIESLEIKYPLDWWQAFKERWFPVWLLNRFPVQYKEHVVDVKAIYPNFRPSIPREDYRLLIREHIRIYGHDPLDHT